MRKLNIFRLCALALAVAACTAKAPVTYTAASYLEAVRVFADTLIEHGTDTVGPRRTALFASVIDSRDFSIPTSPKKVKGTPGVRESDRAVGGCNAQLDTPTLRTMLALSEVTSQTRYAQAVRAYLGDFLKLTPSPQTGLLGWGEHLYYDFTKDAVAATQFDHEYLEWTPPLDLLWAVDPEAVKKEVAGLRYHFFAETPADGGWLYNRHATWDSATYQKAEKGQPWMKHSGLYAFAYGFVAGKTGDAEARRRALGVGSVYYNARNKETGLAEGCLNDKRDLSRLATLGGTAMMAYWQVKAVQADAQLAPLREQALAMLHAYAERAWDEKTGSYHELMTTAGQPADEKAVSPWSFAYNNGSDLMRFGRVAAYIARTERDEASALMARRAWAALKRVPMPKKYTPEEAGFAIHLALDLYDQEHDAACLEAARAYAGKALTALVRHGLICRLPGDPYYESKVGPGDLASALLRLHLRVAGKADPAGTDWSF